MMTVPNMASQPAHPRLLLRELESKRENLSRLRAVVIFCALAKSSHSNLLTQYRMPDRFRILRSFLHLPAHFSYSALEIRTEYR